jgi:nitrite transporter NirC
LFLNHRFRFHSVGIRRYARRLLPHGAEISLNGFFHNQIFVTLGNLVGGGAFVGLVYWLATPSMQVEAGCSLQAEFEAVKTES